MLILPSFCFDLSPSALRFVIHSPSVLAQKYWITNSAVDAQWCVVFAQTIVGGASQGIHGFLVRVRNDDHTVAKGVRLEDVSAIANSGNSGCDVEVEQSLSAASDHDRD